MDNGLVAWIGEQTCCHTKMQILNNSIRKETWKESSECKKILIYNLRNKIMKAYEILKIKSINFLDFTRIVSKRDA